MRSALLAVKGVSRAQVKLEEHEAIVTFDASLATVKDLIEAVGEAVGPSGQKQYNASVKKDSRDY